MIDRADLVHLVSELRQELPLVLLPDGDLSVDEVFREVRYLLFEEIVLGMIPVFFSLNPTPIFFRRLLSFSGSRPAILSRSWFAVVVFPFRRLSVL